MFSKQIFALALLGLVLTGDVALGGDPEFDCNVCVYEVGKLLEPGQLAWIESLIVPVLCSTLSILSGKCETFLDKYISKFINQTIALGPKQLCIDMGACNATAPTAPPKIVLAEVAATKSAACDACYLGVEYLKAIIGDRSIELQIQALLSNYVCTNYPSTNALCKQIVQNVIPNVITALLRDLTTANLCYKSSMDSNPPCAGTPN